MIISVFPGFLEEIFHADFAPEISVSVIILWFRLVRRRSEIPYAVEQNAVFVITDLDNRPYTGNPFSEFFFTAGKRSRIRFL